MKYMILSEEYQRKTGVYTHFRASNGSCIHCFLSGMICCVADESARTDNMPMAAKF